MNKKFKLVTIVLMLFWTLPLSGAIMATNYWMGVIIYFTQVPLCINLVKVFNEKLNDTE